MKQCVKAKAVAVLLLVLAVTGVASAQQGTSEIGRASCRERVL